MKKKPKTKIAAVVFGVCLLSGCAGQVTNQDVGTVAGGVVGGVAGNAIFGGPAGAIGGAVGGALIGNQIGRQYDYFNGY